MRYQEALNAAEHKITQLEDARKSFQDELKSKDTELETLQQEFAKTTSELQSTNLEWNDVLIIDKVKAYHHRDKAFVAKSFATGEVKLQELKSHAAVKRLVTRDISGMIVLNVPISSSMEFKGTRVLFNGKTIALS